MATDRNDELLKALLVQGSDVLAALGDIRDRLPAPVELTVAGGPAGTGPATDAGPVDVDIKEPQPPRRATTPRKAAKSAATKETGA